MRSLKIILSSLLILLLSVQAGISAAASLIYKDYSQDSDLSVDNDNLPPVTDFSFTKKQKMDIVVVLGSGTYTASTVQSKLNSIVNPVLADKGIEANFNIISSNNALDIILPTLTWGESSERYYIAVSNGTFPELSDVTRLTNIIGLLNKEDICFIGMGNSGNQAVIEKLIKNNFSKGFYTAYSNIDTALTRLANYLSSNVSVDLYFNLGKSSTITYDVLSNKIESILKPKMVANDINTNITINNGTYETLANAKIDCAQYTYTSIALRADGTVWILPSASRVPGENGVGYLNNVVDVAGGYGPTYYAVGSEGCVYAWGSNWNLSLGLGSSDRNLYVTYPTKVSGGSSGSMYLSGIVAVSSQGSRVVALKSDGTVWQWGGLWETGANALVPQKVKGPNGVGYLSNIVKIETNYSGTFAIDSAGNLYGWGTNCPYINDNRDDCALGLGPNVAQVPNPRLIDTNVVDISTCFQANAYQKNDGSIWAFGNFEPGVYETHYYDTYLLEYPVRVYNNASVKLSNVFVTPFTVHAIKDNGSAVVVYQSTSGGSPAADVEIQYAKTGTDIYKVSTYFTSSGVCAYFIKNDGTVIQNTRYSYSTLGGGATGETYFNLKSKIAYPYDEMLYSAPFRGEADQYFIELSDSALPELSDPSKVSSISSYLKDNNIKVFAIGSSANSTQLRNLLSQNDNKGDYYDISNLDAAINNLADYIVNNAMKPPRLINDYFVVSDTLEMPTTFYSDIESDPYDSRWVYEHDPYSFYLNTGSTIPFDNSTGYFSLDRKTLSQPVTSFVETDSKGGSIGKVGGYKVKLQVQDKPKSEDPRFSNYNRDSNTVTRYLNLHRRPVAYFTVSVTDLGTKYNIKLSDSGYSYDPDHTSRSDKGIAKRLWGIATVSADGTVTWKYSKNTDSSITYTVPKGSNYLLSLEVQDIDGPYGSGAWSDPVVVGFPGKPIALFSITPNPLPVTQIATVTDMSYVTIPGYTIAQRRWNIKKVGSTSFNYANQPVCKTDYSDAGIGEYHITLEVQDSSGAWSLPFTRILYVLDTAAPVVGAVPASRAWANTDVVVILASHDDGGSGLKRIDYIWTKDPADISCYSSANISGNDYNTLVSQSANGKWYLCARASDNSDNYSNNGNFSIFGTYNIDKVAPTVSTSFAPGTYQSSVSTTINAVDTGGSGIKSIQYKWANTAAKPASGWTTANVASPEDNSESVYSTIDTEGTWYLHMQVADHAGNTAYICNGPLIIQNLSITDIDISGYWNHWRGQVDMFGKRLTNEPHRFLSLECIRVNVNTTGDPDRVTIRFSTELEAMGYTDPDGHEYYYRDYFGRIISFPSDSTFPVSGNHVYWEYNLPLAPSSKDWNDNRLRPQYSMTVTAYKGGRSVTKTINDIDITGNIYDLTYIQPRD